MSVSLCLCLTISLSRPLSLSPSHSLISSSFPFVHIPISFSVFLFLSCIPLHIARTHTLAPLRTCTRALFLLSSTLISNQLLTHSPTLSLSAPLRRNKKRFHHQALVEVKILDHLRRRDPDQHHSVIHMLDYFYFRNHLCITFELMGSVRGSI